MAESRDWKVGDRRGRDDDLMSGIGDEDIMGRPDEEDEDDEEEFEDTEDLDFDDEKEESDR